MEAGSVSFWIRVACCRNVSPLGLHLRPLGVAVWGIRLRTTCDSMLLKLWNQTKGNNNGPRMSLGQGFRIMEYGFAVHIRFRFRLHLRLHLCLRCRFPFHFCCACVSVSTLFAFRSCVRFRCHFLLSLLSVLIFASCLFFELIFRVNIKSCIYEFYKYLV